MAVRFIPCEIWASPDAPASFNPANAYKVQDYNFIIPYANPNNMPSTGRLSTNGILNDNYYALIDKIPDISAGTCFLSYTAANNPITVPAILASVFPRFYPITSSGSISLYYYYKSRQNGRWMYCAKDGSSSGGAALYVYSESGSVISSSLTGQSQAFASSDDERYAPTLVYHTLTEDGHLDTYSVIVFRQTSTSGNQLDLYAIRSGDNRWINDFFADTTPIDPEVPTDPYGWNEPTGPSEPIEEHVLVHNDVDFPTLPTATLADAGFVSLWTPTKEQLQTLARYMWNIDITSIDFWKKLVASPLELIFGLSIIPYDVHDNESPYHVYQDPLTMGYVNTRIDMDYIEEQFIEVDFGSVDLTEYIGAYLDYDPYTKFSIFLPYIGVKDLSADDIMNRTVSLKYRIDLASGACVAMIKCTGTDPTIGNVDSVFYSFSGSCSTQVPISASQQQELVRSIVSIGVGVAATAATIFTGGLTAVGAATAVGATANGALGLKSHYAHSGNMGSTAGFMGVQTPYLIVSRPRLAIPGDQNIYMGYPSFITMTLGDLSGYTEVEVTHLDRLDCTEEEMSEIAELLKKGVYF